MHGCNNEDWDSDCNQEKDVAKGSFIRAGA
jgi:hypothetical protein